MIEQLTPEQEALLPVYAQKWINIGLNTGPADQEKAFAAIKNFLRKKGAELPTKCYKYRSPSEALIGIRLYEVLDGEYIEDPRAYLAEHPELEEEVNNTEDLRRIFNGFYHNNQDAYWISLYDYFHRETEVTGLDIIEEVGEITLHCGWISPYKDVVFIQDNPEFIKFDENNLAHCETGPYLRYSDGMSIYAWHGTTIPGEWIEDKSTITPEVMLRWEDVEQRRCAIEIIGWAEALKLMDCKVIDEDANPSVGTLLEADIPEIGREKFLKVVCGTGRDFALPVPPEMKTAIESQAWLNFCTEEEIRNLCLRT